MKKNIYNYFGIKKDANIDQIKKAYRKKSKEVHPDLKGNQAAFEECNNFYNILISPESRKIYDETGEINKNRNDIDTLALSLLCGVFEQVLLSGFDYKYQNLFDLIRKKIEDEILKIKKQNDDIDASNINMNEVIKRIECKSQEDIISRVISDKINHNKAAKIENDRNIKIRELAIIYLEDYKYKCDNRPDEYATITFTNLSGTGFFGSSF